MLARGGRLAGLRMLRFPCRWSRLVLPQRLPRHVLRSWRLVRTLRRVRTWLLRGLTGQKPQRPLDRRRHNVVAHVFWHIIGQSDILRLRRLTPWQVADDVSHAKLIAVHRDEIRFNPAVITLGALDGAREQRLTRRHLASEPQVSQTARCEIMPYHVPYTAPLNEAPAARAPAQASRLPRRNHAR